MTEQDAAHWELLFDAAMTRMLDSDHFRTVLKGVVLEVMTAHAEVGKMQLPKLLVATCAARGVYLRVDERGELVGSGSRDAVSEEVRHMIALYRPEIIRFLRRYRPQAVASETKPAPVNGAAPVRSK